MSLLSTGNWNQDKLIKNKYIYHNYGIICEYIHNN